MRLFIKKSSWILLTTFLAISSVFFAIRLAPGDPVEKILGPEATNEEIVKVKEELGLDKSIVSQYADFIKGVFTGDLGNSLINRKPVVNEIKDYLTPSMVLAFISVSISAFVGVFIGVIAALKRKTSIDQFLRVLTLVFLSFPIFSLAPILVIIFSIQFNLLPVSEWGSPSQAVLPILTLVLPLSCVIARLTRNRYLEEEGNLWITVLLAKGFDNKKVAIRVVYAILPTVLTVLSIQLSVVLAGTIITETIFDIPGLGLLLFEAIQNRDYPIVQGVVAYSTIIYLLVYFIFDYLSEKIDPRISE